MDEEDSQNSMDQGSPYQHGTDGVPPSIAAKTLRRYHADENDEDSASFDDGDLDNSGGEDEEDSSMLSTSLDISAENMEDNDEEDDDNDDNDASVTDERPRGKVLRLPSKNNDDDDDDDDEDEDDEDVQVAAVIADDDDTSIVETSIAEPIPDNEKRSEDNDIAIAQVVADGNESDTPVVAEVVPKKVRKKPGPKPKKKEKNGTKDKTSGKKRKKKGSKTLRGLVITRDKLEAAQKARDILLSSMKHTPLKVSDSHVIQNVGRVVVENDESKEPVFSNPTSLFPVGFCCDRYEFSPVHGRIIKLRCEILDGREIEKNLDSEKKKEESSASKKKRTYKGPLFRITWGQGVDNLTDGKPFPFDLYSSAAPMGGEVDTVAVPMGLDVSVVPEAGMRVKVRFEKDKWYRGTIKKVVKKDPAAEAKEKKRGTRSKKNKKLHYLINIKYDDGMKEEIAYPDPDVVLIAPSSEGIENGKSLNVTEVHGKPVISVVGKSPLEAWANALIKFGLIDEIMYEKALESIENARAEGMKEVKDKMDALKRQRQEAKAKLNHKQKDHDSEKESNTKKESLKTEDATGEEPKASEENVSSEKEPSTQEEDALKEKVAKLKEDFNVKMKESQAIAVELADARIDAIGTFLSNPFYDDENQQKTWLTTIIKKEKSKMGSTGNKRKIVTPTDILDRNATFYSSEIEHLLEGLPGSEFCSDYVFHDLRGHGASQYSFVHEVNVRKEKAKEKKKRKKMKEKEKVQSTAERERERKRKAKEDARENKKKQKLEVLDQQKKARKEERLSRLSTQVGERLFKEASFQRERVVLLASKLFGKEIARRKKAAEAMASHSIDASKSSIDAKIASLDELPPLSEKMDVHIVRLYDFLITYKEFFLGEGALSEIPSIDKLQKAVRLAGSVNSKKEEKEEYISILNSIAMAMTKPLTQSLIKTLSSPLTTSLNNEDEDNPRTEKERLMDPDDLLVLSSSWREVARSVLLMDVLNEQGLTKIEQTHVLRGYRSGGHPNSKEAKRIRRGEDSELVLRRQAMVINADDCTSIPANFESCIRVPTPSIPSVTSSNWLYYLHNIKALPSNAASGMKSNLRKATKILKASTDFDKKTSYMSKIETNIDLLDQIGTTYTSTDETIDVCKKVRKSILKLLDKATGETFASSKNTQVQYRDVELSIESESNITQTLQLKQKPIRTRGGMQNELCITRDEYKKCKKNKEAYISAAIRFKEEEERKKNREDGEDDDDDDDDDDDNDEDMEEEKKDTFEDKDSPVKKDPEGDERINQLFKRTEFDEFCADEPDAPELLRRCLAVLRNLCQSSPAETFLYPVDPQSNLRYYDSVVTPMSLYDIGIYLQQACKRSFSNEAEIESVVTEFGRKVRLIGKNVSCFSPVGSAIISTAEELLRIFERLLFDWVLAPSNKLPLLEELDDERCVEYHSSDDESMVLLCDGCEGKYNMSRLHPPLKSVPKGDWYCPRCRSGYCWSTVDPRIGKDVEKELQTNNKTTTVKGVITECRVFVSDDNTKDLIYTVSYGKSGEETWSLKEVDNTLNKLGCEIEPIQCFDAVVESFGYGCGADSGLVRDLVPVQIDPKFSDSAAQRFISSSLFCDTILSCASLLTTDTSGMTCEEWVRLLNLLMTKCMSSDELQELASKVEDDANTKMSEKLSDMNKLKAIEDILPKLAEDESVDMSEISLKSESQHSAELDDGQLEEKRQKLSWFKSAKERKKTRENVFLANAIKKQIKPAVSSLEEDHITEIINNALVNNVHGIDIASLRCPAQCCDLCGLTDIAVGTPLVRYPNEEEWVEIAPSTLRKRRMTMIADMTPSSPESTSENEERKSLLVTVKVGGELIDDDEHINDGEAEVNISKCGLVPRHPVGYQKELGARFAGGPPVLPGSLSVHDCCAQAAHKARIDRMVQEEKEKVAAEIEREFSAMCGKSVPIGTDRQGRSYWKLSSCPNALFVTEHGKEGTLCHRYSAPETIASMVVCLGKCKLAEDIKRGYQDVSELLQSRKWIDLLQKRAYTLFKSDFIDEDGDVEMKEADDDNVFDDEVSVTEFDVGDEVFVLSVSSDILWDANIVSVAKKEEDGPITAYRVHYKDWSSRFDEWVAPSRLREMTDENIELQNKAQNRVNQGYALPIHLKTLNAASYIDSPFRNRGFLSPPNLQKISNPPPSATVEEIKLQLLKASLLLVEISLPSGSLKVVWKPKTAEHWRSMVKASTTPGNLMGCLVLLENALSKEWIRPNGEHLLSCLPRHWKCINEATTALISLRLHTLDRGIKYGIAKDENGHLERIDE